MNTLESWAPTAYAEDFDNVGLLVGDETGECTKTLITLDTTEAVVDEAIKNNCQLIISFHPIIFSGLKKANWKNICRKSRFKRQLKITLQFMQFTLL
jgi:putative NIF3 family GTP cyclohydrolase 1 type 2